MTDEERTKIASIEGRRLVVFNRKTRELQLFFNGKLALTTRDFYDGDGNRFIDDDGYLVGTGQ